MGYSHRATAPLLTAATLARAQVPVKLFWRRAVCAWAVRDGCGHVVANLPPLTARRTRAARREPRVTDTSELLTSRCE